jgi:hypothetical protein
MEKSSFEKAVDKLRPDIEKMVREIDNLPAACVTGFIFSFNPKGFIQFGNTENEGDDLIRLHMTLSALAAEMKEKNPYVDVPYTEVGMGAQPVGQAPEEIADALARQVLITGMDPEHSAACLSLAERYLISRRTPENGN